MSPVKTDEPIEMAFGLWTQMGPRNHVLHGIQIPQSEGAIYMDIWILYRDLCNSG